MLKEVFKKSPDRVWQRLFAGTPSQKAIRLSLVFHLSIFFLCLSLGLMQAFLAWLRPQKPSLHVFSLESLSSPQAPEGEKSVSSPSTPTTAKKKPSPSIQFQSLPKAKPILSPTKEGSKPLEKLSSKPNPKPVAKEPSAQKVSYEDFLKAQAKNSPPTVSSKALSLASARLGQALNTAQPLGAGLGSPLEAYIGQMKETIDKVWQKPLGLKGGIEALVEFEVDAAGKVTYYKIIKRSQHTLFDASIEKAFQPGLVLPAPPGGKQVFQLAFKSLED